MGCMASTQRIDVSAVSSISWPNTAVGKGETVVAALARLDEEIAKCEKSYPTARLAVVIAEVESLQQEVSSFEESTELITKDSYAKTIHQLFVSLDLYRRPLLASGNEDFIANVNRKEMRRLEILWLRTRQTELQKERRLLNAQILRIRSLYAQNQQLLESLWGSNQRPGVSQESALSKATALRDALGSVSAKLRAAADYAQSAVRLLEDVIPAWKLTYMGKSGWERTAACADTCRLLVQARCLERGARRVLSSPAAPRAARTLRLALDYAFTDAIHDHKYQRATEIFLNFKEALVQLIDSIHQVTPQGWSQCNFIGIGPSTSKIHKEIFKDIEVLLNNLENLAVADKEVAKCRRELQAARVNAIVQKGLAELKYETKALTSLKIQTISH